MGPRRVVRDLMQPWLQAFRYLSANVVRGRPNAVIEARSLHRKLLASPSNRPSSPRYRQRSRRAIAWYGAADLGACKSGKTPVEQAAIHS